MTRARDVADTQDNLGGAVAPFVAGKNAVINGGFDIWQRGTSFAVPSTSTSSMIADRWNVFRGATGSTASRQVTGDTTNLPNIQYCLRFQRDSGNTSTANLNLIQNLETVNSIPFAGKTATLSFYARAGANYSATSNALIVLLRSGTGTDQNFLNGYTGVNDVISGTATLTTTWQRFTFSGTVPTTATELAIQIQENPTGTAGANDWFEVTGVQLEIGSAATPFARAGGSIGGELALCQRYFYAVNRNLVNRIIGQVISTNRAIPVLMFPVPMRTTPSVTYDTSTNYTVCNVSAGDATVGSISTLASTNNSLAIDCQSVTGSPLVAGSATMFIFSTNNTNINAEL